MLDQPKYLIHINIIHVDEQFQINLSFKIDISLVFRILNYACMKL